MMSCASVLLNRTYMWSETKQACDSKGLRAKCLAQAEGAARPADSNQQLNALWFSVGCI